MNIKTTNKIGRSILLGAVMAFGLQSLSAGPGRIAYVADGNSPDPDDIGAMSATLALLRASGNEGKLVHCSHSCDLVNHPNISASEELQRRQLMQDAADDAAAIWGGFGGLTFWNCRTQQTQAVNDLAADINASTAGNRLYIIEAGEPDIIYFALDQAQLSKSQYVTIITHSAVNDNTGDFHNLSDIEQDFNVSVARIPDQNQNLNKPRAQWSWAQNHPDSRIREFWKHGDIAANLSGIPGNIDVSDSGMVYYWITGATGGGTQTPTINDFKTMMENFVNNGNPGGGSFVSLRRRSSNNNFAMDGGVGGSNGQNVKMWGYSSTNVNQQWEEISRGNNFFTYKKRNTIYVLDGGGGVAQNNDNVKLWNENTTNQNQHWRKVGMGSGYFRLEKRNADTHSIDGGGGPGFNNQNVKLWNNNNGNFNQHWLIQ